MTEGAPEGAFVEAVTLHRNPLWRLAVSLGLLFIPFACALAADRTSCNEAMVRRTSVSVSAASARWLAPGATWRDDAGTTHAGPHAGFCRVIAMLEQEVGIEIWLPARRQWNGHYLQAGVGGEAGTYNYVDMARGLRHGFAVASTDAGHKAGDLDWAFRHPDRRTNFASRGNHVLAVAAKAIADSYYGRPVRRAYFLGCSGGGREGLKEAQSYPEDFDGILAGDAAPDQLAASLRLLWTQYVVEPQIRSLLSQADWKMIAAAGIAACDADDGVVDGIVEDPPSCRFALASLECPRKTGGPCLSPQQLAAAQRVYAPLTDEDGQSIDDGLLPGVQVTMEPRSSFAFSLFGKVVHDDPNWDPATLDMAADLRAARVAWPDLPNDRADLSAYRDRGGKLIVYHGWMDPFILAGQSIRYFDRVARETARSQQFSRLYLVPGMGHCRGGPGADQFGGAGAESPAADERHDLLQALRAWVEHDRAPGEIVASHVDGGRTTFTRKLCEYPHHDVYDGRGPTESAASFRCE